jgi:hypothetical protein
MKMSSTAINMRVRLSEFLVTLLQMTPNDSAGSEKPATISAMIFAIGIRMSAGKKIIA